MSAASGTVTRGARACVPLRAGAELRAHSASAFAASMVPSASGATRPARIALWTAVSVTPRWRAYARIEIPIRMFD